MMQGSGKMRLTWWAALLALIALLSPAFGAPLAPQKLSLAACPDSGDRHNNTFLFNVYSVSPNSIIRTSLAIQISAFQAVFFDEPRLRLLFAEYFTGTITTVQPFSYIRAISADGKLANLVGGAFGFNGDNIPALDPSLRMTAVTMMSVHPATGDLLFIENGAHRMRRVNGSTSIVTTVAGSGATRVTGDFGPPALAAFPNPYGLYWDWESNRQLVTHGSSGQIVRFVDLGRNNISTFAGKAGIAGYFDGPTPFTSLFNMPFALSLRRLNVTAPPTSLLPGPTSFELIIADRDNQVIRLVSANGTATTFAGQPVAGDLTGGAFSALERPGDVTPLKSPTDVVWDEEFGTMYIAENGAAVIRAVLPPSTLTSREDRSKLSLDQMKSTNRFTVLAGIHPTESSFSNTEEGVVALGSPVKPLRLHYNSARALMIFSDAGMKAIRGITCRRKRKNSQPPMVLDPTLTPQQALQRDLDDGIIPTGYYLNLTDNILRDCGALLGIPAAAAPLVPGGTIANLTARMPRDICCPANLGAIHFLGSWLTFNDLPVPCFDGGCSPVNGTCVPGLEPSAAAKAAATEASASSSSSSSLGDLTGSPADGGAAFLPLSSSTCPKGFFCIPSFSPAATSLGANNSDYNGTSNAVLTVIAVRCPVGTLCNAFNLTAPLACPPGHVCATPALDAVPCAAGFYCPNAPFSNASAYACPRGHFCPLASTAPHRCPRGTWNAALGMASPEDCRPCPLHSYAATSANDDASRCLLCPNGSKTFRAGSQSASECVDLRELFGDLSAFDNRSSTSSTTSSSGSGVVAVAITSSSNFVQQPKEHVCEPGTQPQAGFLPRSQSDCIPLSCEKSGLFPSLDNRTCMGCPPGTIGKPPPYGSCTRPAECSNNNDIAAAPGLCVGFASKPFPSLKKLDALTQQLSSLSTAARGPAPSNRLLSASSASSPSISTECSVLAEQLAFFDHAATGQTLLTSTTSSTTSPVSAANSAKATIGIVFGVIGGVVLIAGCAAMAGLCGGDTAADEAEGGGLGDTAATTEQGGNINNTAGAFGRTPLSMKKKSPLSSIPSPLHHQSPATATMATLSINTAPTVDSTPRSRTSRMGGKIGVGGFVLATLRLLDFSSFCGAPSTSPPDDENANDDEEADAGGEGGGKGSKPTAFGGLVSFLAALLVLCFWLLLIVENALLSSSSPSSLGSSFSSSLQPFGSISAVVSPSSTTGLRFLLVSGTGESNACVTGMQWRASGIVSSANTSISTSLKATSLSCGELAGHLFFCEDCLLSPSPASSPSLTITLDWSCQSLLLFAFALGADGSTTTAAVSASATVTAATPANAASNASVALLSSLQWKLSPMMQLLLGKEGSTASPQMAAGYSLLAASTAGALSVSRTEITGSAFLPAQASVQLSLDLSPSPFMQVLTPVAAAGDDSTSSSSGNALGVFCAMMGVAAGFVLAASCLLQCVFKHCSFGIPLLPLAIHESSSAHREAFRTSSTWSVGSMWKAARSTRSFWSSRSPSSNNNSGQGAAVPSKRRVLGLPSFFSSASRSNSASTSRAGSTKSLFGGRTASDLKRSGGRGGPLATPSVQRLEGALNQLNARSAALAGLGSGAAGMAGGGTSAARNRAVAALPRQQLAPTAAAPSSSLPHAAYYYRSGASPYAPSAAVAAASPSLSAASYTTEAARSPWAYRLAIQNNATIGAGPGSSTTPAGGVGGAPGILAAPSELPNGITSSNQAKVRLMHLGTKGKGGEGGVGGQEEHKAVPLRASDDEGDEGDEDGVSIGDGDGLALGPSSVTVSAIADADTKEQR